LPVALQKIEWMKNKLILYVGFFIVLFAVYMYFVFSQTDISQSSLPVVNNNVDNFVFTDQNGKKITERDVDGKVYVTEYFFTTCKGICPRMNNNMYKIYETFRDENDFMIISHTSDPETDSAAVLKRYSDSLKVDTRKWVFLTGRKDSLYNQARISYLLDDPKNNVTNINDQFLHTQFFALIDKNGNMRGGVYDGLRQEDMDKLKSDVQILLKEKAGNGNFTNHLFGN